MTARPSSDYATVTVNKFNTSLPVGQTLVNFTANTTNKNNVTFTISSISPSENYIIEKGGINFTATQADSSGTITFSNSDWPAGAFTVEEEAPPAGSITGEP